MTDWPVKTLGEVCEVVNGATPKTGVKEYWGGSHAWITPAEMGNLDSPLLSMSRRTLSDRGLAACSATLVPPKTVILSSRAPIGHLVINEVPMATNQGCKSLIPSDGLDCFFLYYYLKANVELLDSLGTGAVFKELSGTQLKTVEIPVPPLEEQKRIVELLDAATARVTELTACYEQARTHANDLFTSALRDALESNPDWPVKTLGDICDIYQPKTIGTKDLIADGKYIVYGANGPIGRYDRFNHEHSEVTVTCRGATCGTVNVTPPEVWITGNAMVVRPSEVEMTKQMMRYVLESLDYSSIITGAAQPQITRQNLAPSTIQVPPLEEQKRIVAHLDSLRAKTSEMVVAYDAKLTAAKNLRQSILEAAFAGDL